MANEHEENEPVEMTGHEVEIPVRQPVRKPSERRDDVVDNDAEAIRAELERTRKALKDANKEAADRRRRLDELEAVEEDKRRAGLSEMERLKAERADAVKTAAEAERKAEDAEERLQRTIEDAAIEREATRMNFIYPDIAPSLVDRKRISRDEETGRPAGIKEALERLLKDKPELAYAAPSGGTPPRDGPRRLRGGGRGDRAPDIEAELRASGKYA
jgi:chromosome segregation ATPase